MDLISKKVITSQIANQRKIQIDEGVALAKKIDLLRETLSSLELQHKNFLDKKEKELLSVTSNLEKDISNKKIEIKKLEEHRLKLLLPLDREKRELEDLKKEILNSENVVKEKIILLNKQQQDLNQKQYNIEELNKDVLSKSQEALEQSKLAFKKLEEAEIVLSNAKKTEKEVFEKIEVSKKNINQLEESVKTREIEVSIKENHIKLQQEEINKIKIQLADRSETLDRAMKRIQNATIN